MLSVVRRLQNTRIEIYLNMPLRSSLLLGEFKTNAGLMRAHFLVRARKLLEKIRERLGQSRILDSSRVEPHIWLDFPLIFRLVGEEIYDLVLEGARCHCSSL